ncbi:hypothetical protein [Rhodococcoides fascians]|uniref:hypothetical protein n=1 Tax=Rhodococcoides fascians TaxID=1828 RepID=UPI0012D31E13|nr:hypothetical protein [Rhodococcus fascians]
MALKHRTLLLVEEPPEPSEPATLLDSSLSPDSTQIELTPELIDALTPADPGWLTQPVATILAASIALLAAAVAYRGVLRQIKANRSENRKNRLSDLKIAQRSETIEVLTKAADAADALCGVATGFQVAVENPELFDDPEKAKSDAKSEFDSLYTSTRFLIRKLDVIGLEKSSLRLEAVLNEAHSIVEQLHEFEDQDEEEWEWTIYEVRDEAVECFKTELNIDLDAPVEAGRRNP